MIGALNAGSNITGVLTNTNAFSALLHKYNALAFWDYAAAAPYVKIDMNPPNNELAYKDGVYFSMHKFVGGPDSPGMHVWLCVYSYDMCMHRHERKLCKYFAFCMCVYVYTWKYAIASETIMHACTQGLWCPV